MSTRPSDVDTVPRETARETARETPRESGLGWPTPPGADAVPMVSRETSTTAGVGLGWPGEVS
ncbi:MAG: hypothetical protein K9G24_08745 [Candidatus Nanopelagicales bacterium]|nr:hypothetical protein [Candidatus Nanopelagicales bacterium]MCF8537263.1 hypothetical protein [Candidatus Nanopelagicales bacterium]MCF8543153.1 hypothetical protein [Candidatus Nanopelagicales bacterium]MCF8558005.1 hypothetical protein [Candidatus Nanopelagicales bacterium]